MSNWYCVYFDDAMLASEPLHNIKLRFHEEFGEYPEDKSAAIFFRHESEGRLHCATEVYFPPVMQAMALAFHAQPCSKPRYTGLDLLIGSRKSWAVYFAQEDA